LQDQDQIVRPGQSWPHEYQCESRRFLRDSRTWQVHPTGSARVGVRAPPAHKPSPTLQGKAPTVICNFDEGVARGFSTIVPRQQGRLRSSVTGHLWWSELRSQAWEAPTGRVRSRLAPELRRVTDRAARPFIRAGCGVALGPGATSDSPSSPGIIGLIIVALFMLLLYYRLPGSGRHRIGYLCGRRLRRVQGARRHAHIGGHRRVHSAPLVWPLGPMCSSLRRDEGRAAFGRDPRLHSRVRVLACVPVDPPNAYSTLITTVIPVLVPLQLCRHRHHRLPRPCSSVLLPALSPHALSRRCCGS